MTPEEKQAIFDKAKELGFLVDDFRDLLYYQNDFVQYFFIYKATCAFYIGRHFESSTFIKRFKSTSDLERLFKAIVS